MGVKSTFEELFYKNHDQFSYHVNVYFPHDINDIYFIHNEDPTNNRLGYRPAYLIHPAIDEWLRKSVGVGQRGSPLPGETNYVNRLPDQKWWHGWSYDHDYRSYYIYVHFTKKSDALAFKMVWG